MSDFRSLLAAGLMLAASVATAAAEEACIFEAWLLRMVHQTNAVAAATGKPGLVRQQAGLARTLAAFDRPEMRRAMAREGYGDFAPLTGRHVASARALLANPPGSPGRDAALRRLGSSGARLLAAVARIDCAATSEEPARSATRVAGTAPGAGRGTGLWPAFDGSAGLALLLAAAALAGLLLLEHRTRSRKRRNRRFVCDIPCRIRLRGRLHDSRIVDISEAGAKLQLGMEGSGDAPVDIEAGTFAAAGRVVWANTHYCGADMTTPASLHWRASWSLADPKNLSGGFRDA